MLSIFSHAYTCGVLLRYPLARSEDDVQPYLWHIITWLAFGASTGWGCSHYPEQFLFDRPTRWACESLMYLQLRAEVAAALSAVNYAVLICSDIRLVFPPPYFLIQSRGRDCYCRKLRCQEVVFRAERWGNRDHPIFLGFARPFVEQAVFYLPQIMWWRWLLKRLRVLRWKLHLPGGLDQTRSDCLGKCQLQQHGWISESQNCRCLLLGV